AHGFLTLSEVTEVEYKVDEFYTAESEGGVVWNDPDIGIDWPIEQPIIAQRDSEWPRLKDLKTPFNE
ncbi:unnamed protein product, partial [marine sediment metagenome]